MNKKILILSIAIIAILFLGYKYVIANDFEDRGYTPPEGFVPNDTTAIKVAEAIWIPIYGEEILQKKPFTARLQGDTLWVVEGTLPSGKLGGVPYIEIRKRDCAILKVAHGK